MAAVAAILNAGISSNIKKRISNAPQSPTAALSLFVIDPEFVFSFKPKISALAYIWQNTKFCISAYIMAVIPMIAAMALVIAFSSIHRFSIFTSVFSDDSQTMLATFFEISAANTPSAIFCPVSS